MPSAVRPSTRTPFQALVNPEIRLKQTVKASRLWIRRAKSIGFRIILGDNSGSAGAIARELNLDPIEREFFKIKELDAPSNEDIERGKGACETLSLISLLGDDWIDKNSVVAKCNARYFVTNGCLLVERLTRSFDFAAWPSAKFDKIDTTFFIGRRHFLESILPSIYAETNDVKGLVVETLYAKSSIHSPNCDFERFSYMPAIRGQSGSTGATESFLNESRLVSSLVRSRQKIRNTLNFVKPRHYYEKLEVNNEAQNG